MRGKKTPPEVINAMRARDAAGMSRVDIAREFHTTPPFVTRVLGAKQRKPANDNQGEPEAA